MTLNGKVALVTGGGRGIGKGCAIELARAGAAVIVNDRPGSPDLEQTIREIEQLGVEGTGIEGDVFRREGCEAVAAQAWDRHGHIDLFVSNPAFSRRSEFLEFDPELFEQVVQGTLIGGFHMSQLIARRMVERGEGGKIVFISSVQAEIPASGSTAYNGSKAGLNHMARTIAAELAGDRINVNVIEPGWIETPGEHQSFGEDRIREEAPKLPWGRIGTPADIGRAAAFLCSDAADYITGSILAVDGGYRLKDCLPDTAILPKTP